MSPMPKPSASILALAKRGAEARLSELVKEAQHLIALFPYLRDSFDKDELPVSFILRVGAERPAGQPLGKRQMSAAARGDAARKLDQSAVRKVIHLKAVHFTLF